LLSKRRRRIIEKTCKRYTLSGSASSRIVLQIALRNDELVKIRTPGAYYPFDNGNFEDSTRKSGWHPVFLGDIEDSQHLHLVELASTHGTHTCARKE
jgi:hypothetical protein